MNRVQSLKNVINVKQMNLRILDLFSGIGGFSYAFHGTAKTVAYCDIDEHCQAVLKKNMNRGFIDEAPIFEDITKISKDDIHILKPNMITAGFPCQDISSANPHGKGLKGERSGLFSEIIKLIDTYSGIDYVLLENSPRILKKGFRTIRVSMKQRGFQIKYCLINAMDVGAYHKRRRWYCLCYKNHDLPTIPNIQYDWYRMPTYSKIVKIKNRTHKKKLLIRNAMLGNSVVPQCVTYAYNTLVKNILSRKQYIEVVPLKSVHPLHLEFSDGTTNKISNYWATPCSSNWHNYTKITDRGIKLLASQLYYHVDTLVKEGPKTEHYNKYLSNPLFVEYLMGYPKNWTETI